MGMAITGIVYCRLMWTRCLQTQHNATATKVSNMGNPTEESITRVETLVLWVTAVRSCVESPVVTLAGTAVDQSPSVLTVFNDGLSIQSWDVCVSWVAVVRRCVVSSMVTQAGPFDDLISVVAVASVSREGLSVLSSESGPASGEVVSLS